jgi:hypothetical protein
MCFFTNFKSKSIYAKFKHFKIWISSINYITKYRNDSITKYFFIWLTCLTLWPALAEVSINITFNSLAFCSPSSVLTCLNAIN